MRMKSYISLSVKDGGGEFKKSPHNREYTGTFSIKLYLAFRMYL